MNSQTAAIGKYRWTICSLIFFATTINYLDRAVISLLKSDLEKEFNWSESDYSNIVIAFQLAYAIGLLAAGKFIDRVGTRIGYAIAIFTWSLAAIGHAFVRSTLVLGWPARFLELQKPAIFLLPLKPSLNGSLRKNVPWQPEFLIQALISVQSSLH